MKDYDALEMKVLAFLQEKLKGRSKMWFTPRSMAKKLDMTPLLFGKILKRLRTRGFVWRDGHSKRHVFFREPQQGLLEETDDTMFNPFELANAQTKVLLREANT